MEELWSSIFTPGPTPTLLIATNVSFAALQLVLFALLIATQSLHFVALSLISAGLWYSINWFAQEVRLAQQAQDAEKKKKQAESEAGSDKQEKNAPDTVEIGDSDTETESITALKESTSAIATSSAVSATLQPVDRESKKRPSFGGDSSGYASTDSDWEKVGET